MADFDVIVWGATGFTGRLVAEYLAERHGPGEGGGTDARVSWTIAGRNAKKLETLRAELGATGDALPVLVANSSDVDSLREMVRRTRVVCSAVGPYAKYGSDLVRVCAEEGVDYCDLAGEVHWMRRMIDEHEATAGTNGARIVHSCGFDCIPSDLGVHYVQRVMHERHGVYAREVKFRALDFKGGMSGGTADSMMYMLEETERDPGIRRVMQNPYALNPGEEKGLDGPDSQAAFYDEDFHTWAGPFMMAGINTRVVRRTHALLGYPYGRDFRYGEAMLTKDGPVGFTSAVVVSMGSAAMTTMTTFPSIRHLLARFVPKPGDGPSHAAREAGYFKVALLGKHPEDADKDVLVDVQGDRDPGYGSTARMLGESALCLALDGLNSPGGITTPAASMGDALLARLSDHAGVTFSEG